MLFRLAYARALSLPVIDGLTVSACNAARSLLSSVAMAESKAARTRRHALTVRLSDEQNAAFEIAKERLERQTGAEIKQQALLVSLVRTFCENHGCKWPTALRQPTGYQAHRSR